MAKTIRFQTKLFICYSLIIFAIILSLFITFYFYISKSMEGEAIQSLFQIVQKSSSQIDSLFKEMDTNALIASSNPMAKKIFMQRSEKADRTNYLINVNIEENTSMNDLFATLILTMGSIYRVSLYNKYGFYTSYGSLDTHRVIRRRVDSSGFTNWYHQLLVGNGARIISTPHPDFWSAKPRDIVSLYREIIDPLTNVSYGIVEVQQTFQQFTHCINVSHLKNVNVFLINEKNRVIHFFGRPGEQRNISYYLSAIGQKNTGYQKIPNSRTAQAEFLAYNRSDYSGWLVLMTEKEGDLIYPIKMVGWLMIIFGCGVLFITLLVVFVITRRLTKPVEQLIQSAKQVSLDNLSIDMAHENSNNEIIQLNKVLNAMLIRLKDSMDELMQLRASEVKAQMIALQSQMDPHFLYNMLSVISSSSREAGDFKITYICQRLSNMLRYISTHHDDQVAIAVEIEHARNYLILMQTRYEDHFEYHIDVNKQLDDMNIRIPKLTLQPLIENCFRHGLKKAPFPWHITVKADCRENIWYIAVTDNGIGFDVEESQRLNQRADEFAANFDTNMKDLKLGGMGLINTLVRLKFLYKDAMIFKVENHPDRGCTVTIGGKIYDQSDGC